MGKVWVLDTETKGTGANVVPLQRLLERPVRAAAPLYVPPKREPPVPEPAPPAPPPKFKVIDLMTREVLADGAGTRATVDLLRQVRSIVDVTIFVWNPESARWRMLTLDERRTLWKLRGA